MANGQPDKPTHDYRLAFRRVRSRWRELVFASAVVAFIVTPADVTAMLLSMPTILLAITVAYSAGAFVSDNETRV